MLKIIKNLKKTTKQIVVYLSGNNLISVERYRDIIVHVCRVCNDVTKPFQEAYGKFWYRCPNCNFLQSEVSTSLLSRINRGQGFSGGTGIGGGGYREYWLSGLLNRELDLSKILFYEPGIHLLLRGFMRKGLMCGVAMFLLTSLLTGKRHMERGFSMQENSHRCVLILLLLLRFWSIC